MVSEELLFKVKNLPTSPGVYLMKDATGTVIYIGKARVLKNRVSSYFQEGRVRDAGTAAKVARLQEQVVDLDFFATDNEVEALLLEDDLVKRYRPKYNVQLKDDKSFPFVMVTTGERFPRVEVIRGPHLYPQESRFFGPYVDKKAVVRALKTLRKVFPFCTCKEPCDRSRNARPCIYYQLKQCPAPCSGKVSEAAYRENINRLMLFLEGKESELLDQLQADMEAAAGDLDFERAAFLRDQLGAFQKTLRNQAVITEDALNQDVVGFHLSDRQAVVVILFVRDGRLRDKHPYLIDTEAVLAGPEEDLLGQFLAQYYLNPRNLLPREVLLPRILDDLDTLTEALRKNRGAVTLRVPQEGSREFKLVKIASKNAKLVLGQREILSTQFDAELESLLTTLQEKLPHLTKVPRHVEAFDISNTQGQDATGSMVCFIDGVPSKENYRKFKIRGKDTPDDYAMMREVILRRYARLLREHRPLPDLILVDGGKGQLHVAFQALTELHLDHIPVVGLAKREEQVFVPGQSDPLEIPKDSPASLFFQRVRDEAHRFAISYHKQLRQKRAIASPLEAVKGVGPATRKKLLAAFGSLANIQQASVEALANIVGLATARRIYSTFHPD